MRHIILTAMMLLCTAHLQAQRPEGEQRAEQAFMLMQQGQADSIYAMLADDLRTKVAREQFEGGLSTVEQMAGAYQGHGPWQHQHSESGEIYSAQLDFEQGPLSFVVVFDADGRITGIRILPLTVKKVDIPLPDDAVELDDTVRTSPGIALPCAVVLSGQQEQPPLVVMVHGSGPLDKDETTGANSTFLELSRKLAERGISSLRYDKRTLVYRSPVATMDEETTLDAMAAVALARTYTSGRVFLLGHSLGAMMAPEIASRTTLDGIIMMAAPARDLKDVVQEQLEYLSPPENLEELRSATLEQLRQQSPHYLEPQHQVDTAKQLTTPMLILQGERDYQVSMYDFELWQQALQGHGGVVMRSYPKLNHLFLEGEGKSTPQEYTRKGEIPAQVVDDIATFISQSSIKH